MTTEIRMTEREKKLTQASDSGRVSYQHRWGMGDMFKYDEQLKQAWENGYRIAREEAMQDYRYTWR